MLLAQTLSSIFHMYTFLLLESFDIPLRSNDVSAILPKRTMSMSGNDFPSRHQINEFINQKNNLENIITNTRQPPISGVDDPSFKPQSIHTTVVVGIAGGSASGKTTLSNAIIKALGEEYVSIIGHDNYYKDSNLPFSERSKINYDHPDSLDTKLLVEHIKELKKGNNVNIPTYDYSQHCRKSELTFLHPKKIVLIDGMLIFNEPELVSLMDMKIFVDTEDDIRLIRRIQRDTKERGRSVESVIEQYTKTVRPMHQLYVEPSKRKADIIVPAGQGIQPVALDMCISRLREIINFYQ